MHTLPGAGGKTGIKTDCFILILLHPQINLVYLGVFSGQKLLEHSASCADSKHNPKENKLTPFFRNELQKSESQTSTAPALVFFLPFL